MYILCRTFDVNFYYDIHVIAALDTYMYIVIVIVTCCIPETNVLKGLFRLPWF